MVTPAASADSSRDSMAAVVAERDRLQHDNQALTARLSTLEHQLAWFKRQLFGEKSERRPVEPPSEQLCLGEGLDAPMGTASSAEREVGAHMRIPTKPATDSDSCRPAIPTDAGHPVSGVTGVDYVDDGVV